MDVSPFNFKDYNNFGYPPVWVFRWKNFKECQVSSKVWRPALCKLRWLSAITYHLWKYWVNLFSTWTNTVKVHLQWRKHCWWLWSALQDTLTAQSNFSSSLGWVSHMLIFKMKYESDRCHAKCAPNHWPNSELWPQTAGDNWSLTFIFFVFTSLSRGGTDPLACFQYTAKPGVVSKL